MRCMLRSITMVNILSTLYLADSTATKKALRYKGTEIYSLHTAGHYPIQTADQTVSSQLKHFEKETKFSLNSSAAVKLLTLNCDLPRGQKPREREEEISLRTSTNVKIIVRFGDHRSSFQEGRGFLAK